MEGPAGEPWVVKLCASHFPTLNLSLFGEGVLLMVPPCTQVSWAVDR